MQTRARGGAPFLWSGVVVVGLALLGGCDSGTGPVVAPPAPEDVSASPVSMTSIQVSWTLPSGAGADAFVLQRAQDSRAYVPLDTVAGDVRVYVDTALTADTEYRYRVEACNGTLCSQYTSSESARTYAELAITTDSLPFAVVGYPYSVAVHGVGGDGSYSWRVSAGSLPAGLALNDAESPTPEPHGAIISGTPQTAQTAVFTVELESGDEQLAHRGYVIKVLAAPAPVAVKTLVLPPVMEGGLYEVSLAASGGIGSDYAWSLVSGSLPAGLSLGPGGTITGTAAVADTATFTVRATSAGESGEATFTIAVVPNRTTSYEITPYPVVPIPANIRPHVDSAVARWDEVLTGDVPADTIPAGFFDPSYCGGFGDAANGTTVEDVLVLINIAPIDGAGQVLGQAGPCALRGGSSLPVAGILTLDVADLEPLVGTGTLTDIIFHEIGHILGFGTLWTRLNLINGEGGPTPTYTGQQGVSQYHVLGRTGNVPLETTGGEGTRDAHWSEAVFNREIMTGYVEQTGVFEPLSKVTIASFADLGYAVNLAAADPFSLAAGARAGAAEERPKLGRDLLYMGPVMVLGKNGRAETIQLR